MSLRTTLARIAASGVWSTRTRARLLRRSGARIGRARILPGIRFIGDAGGLSVGDGVFINAELLVGANAAVVIADGVSLGPRCALMPTTHELGPANGRAGDTRAEPIRIGEGCWLGAGVTVLSGVSVGAGTVIAAGAVVTSDCDEDSVYGGVPARLLRRIDEPEAPADTASSAER